MHRVNEYPVDALIHPAAVPIGMIVDDSEISFLGGSDIGILPTSLLSMVKGTGINLAIYWVSNCSYTSFSQRFTEKKVHSTKARRDEKGRM
jgi:hypothetical protein